MLCQLSICNILLTKNMYFEYMTINYLTLFIYRENKICISLQKTESYATDKGHSTGHSGKSIL